MFDVYQFDKGYSQPY